MTLLDVTIGAFLKYVASLVLRLQQCAELLVPDMDAVTVVSVKGQ